MPVTDQHYVRQPVFVFYLRIAQLVFALIILALTAFATSVIPNVLGSFGYNIFCCIYSFIFIGYLIITSTWFIALWNMWAALVLEIFAVIFWLSAWGSLAAWAAVWNAATYYSYRKRYINYYDTDRLESAWQCTAAAAGLGALLWVSFVTTLITYSIHLHRWRKSPDNQGMPRTGEPVKAGAVNEMKPVGAYGDQQQAYGGQQQQAYVGQQQQAYEGQV